MSDGNREFQVGHVIKIQLPTPHKYAYIEFFNRIRFQWTHGTIYIFKPASWTSIRLWPFRIKGGRDAVCKCGRRNSYNGNNYGHLEMVGWRKVKNKWNCPFCMGNTSNLKRVFFSTPKGE